MGAAIDALLECYKARRIKECNTVTNALYRVWGRLSIYTESEAVVTAGTADDFPLRVWCDIYRRYKP